MKAGRYQMLKLALKRRPSVISLTRSLGALLMVFATISFPFPIVNNVSEPGNSPWNSVGKASPLDVFTSPLLKYVGIYDLGLLPDGSKGVRFDSAGKAGWDTLEVCSLRRFSNGSHAHQLCFDPVTGRVQTPTGGSTSDGEVEYRPVDLSQIVAKAVDDANLAGMRVNIQPNKGWVFATVPTIVYMTGEIPTNSVNVDGFDVTVTWSVREHQIQFNEPGGGASELVVSTDGAPYPNESITWTYRNEGRTHVSVTTVWDAKVNVAGSSFDMPKQRTTTSTSSEFEVRKPIISLTKPSY